MIQALIIEDEKTTAKQLQKMLERNNIQIVETLHSVKQAQLWMQNNTIPDLIFSDIQLGDGVSFEIFEDLELESFIIFTTAFNEYTLQAFKLNAIDYLLKPIKEEELQQAIAKYKRLQPQTKIQLENLFKNFIQEEKTYKTRFLNPLGTQNFYINTSEINCFYSENKITYAQTEKNLPIEETLEELEQNPNPKDFFRVSRQYIIQNNAIEKIAQFENSRLKIKVKNHPEPIIVSRERVKEFNQWLA